MAAIAAAPASSAPRCPGTILPIAAAAANEDVAWAEGNESELGAPESGGRPASSGRDRRTASFTA